MDPTGYKEGKLGSIRNPDGIWINTQVFREPAIQFTKHGYYCADPWGSPTWFDYWNSEREKCIHGYSVGGVKITGDHYFYLNFCPIQKAIKSNGIVSSKIQGFPDFWDGDYNYFWARELARYGALSVLNTTEEKQLILDLEKEQKQAKLKELYSSLKLELKVKDNCLAGGYNLIVGKSRRKGYSYKAAAVGSRAYFTKPNSLVIFGAYEKKYLYPDGILTKAKNNIDFLNNNTGWAMPSDVINKQDHIKASYIQYKNGIKIEKGFKSQLVGVTFKDNADAARGKDAEEVFFEESGAFGTPGLLKQAYAATQDCVRAGSLKTGMITVFGTSGDMEGGTADYADMHSRPLAFDMLPFTNIWDEGMSDTTCGYFHPVYLNMEGFYDDQGNSNQAAAEQYEIAYRENKIREGATSSEIQERMQENPRGPSEAFGAVSVNNFPAVELKRQAHKVKAMGWTQTKGTPVELIREGNEVQAIPLLDGKAEPIRSFYNVPVNKRGCPVIYEHPVVDAPRGLYKIGYDPVRQDQGSSLAAIIVYKGVHRGSMYHNIIVAEYIGRRSDPEDMDRIAESLADLYNAEIMYENEVTGVKNYFRRIKRLSLLAAQPDAVISKNIKKSKVARVYGCHMNTQLKDAGERYIKTWLLTKLDTDENGDAVTVIDRIYSLRLLEELISYNRKGNFDLISALIMAMMQVQEESLNKEYTSKPRAEAKVKSLMNMRRSMYKRG